MINKLKINQSKLVVFTMMLLSSFAAQTAEITDTYTAGDSLTTTTMENIKSAVNDNDTRITTLEGISGGSITRTISIPARALTFTPGSAIITLDAGGLAWTATFAGSASFFIKKPSDYAGGDITMSLFFRPSTATAGVVAFFLRPTSYNSGEAQIDPGSIPGTGVNVAGVLLTEQNIVIPETRMTKDWWSSSIQRQGTGSTYPDSVALRGISLEYTAVQ